MDSRGASGVWFLPADSVPSQYLRPGYFQITKKSWNSLCILCLIYLLLTHFVCAWLVHSEWLRVPDCWLSRLIGITNVASKSIPHVKKERNLNGFVHIPVIYLVDTQIYMRIQWSLLLLFSSISAVTKIHTSSLFIVWFPVPKKALGESIQK